MLGRLLHLDQIVKLGIYATFYIVIGLASLSTAYLQPNTATIWLPSGFALGLLLAKGWGFWPSIAAGSFILNLIAATSVSFSAVLTAMAIALGNVAEAIFGAYLATRFANGAGFPYRIRSVTRFMLLIVPVAPIISTTVGVAASTLNGSPLAGAISDVALTWYIANAQGILLFGGITVLFLSQNVSRPRNPGSLEVVVLPLAIAFAVQITSGALDVAWLRDWPKSYMLIPFVVWACFRFGSLGGLLSVAFITLGAAIGTMQGHYIFPAATTWQSLIYLQVFLAMLAIVALAIGAALAELDESRSGLEYRISARTRAIEHLLEQRNISTALTAHDLKGPLFGVRNALTATRQAVAEERISPHELADGLEAMEQACTTIVNKIVSVLPQSQAAVTQSASPALRVQNIFDRSVAAHLPAIRARNIAMVLEDPLDTSVRYGPEVENILHTLIDNALRHTPDGSTVRMLVQRSEAMLEISIIDEGPSVSAEQLEHLFQRPIPNAAPPQPDRAPRSGMGLYLAAKQAEGIGGVLTYRPAVPRGACFRLTLVNSSAASRP